MPYNYEHLIYLYNKNIYKFVAYIYKDVISDADLYRYFKLYFINDKFIKKCCNKINIFYKSMHIDKILDYNILLKRLQQLKTYILNIEYIDCDIESLDEFLYQEYKREKYILKSSI